MNRQRRLIQPPVQRPNQLAIQIDLRITMQLIDAQLRALCVPDRCAIKNIAITLMNVFH